MSKDIEEILGQLAGSASLCWQPKPTGVFDSEQATKFVNEAVAQIEQLLIKARIETLRSIDFVGDPVLLEKYLDDRIAE